ncbi:MAG: hypothetical protein EPN92_13415 [Chitinophagaceae bacterium]|nr:MAG: hypothetical protein EPN92_13415 [Chitinophagaceae bacterium]
MAIENRLAVEYHQQDNDSYCGAACAQMILHDIGAGYISQDDLFEEINRQSLRDAGVVIWLSGPDGLTTVLNDLRPPGFLPRYFVLFSLMDAESISRKIVWTIFNYKVGPIALVFDYMHWIVVTGYEASADPITSDDVSYTIEGFFIHNPNPPLSTDPVEPHFSTDTCGTADARGIPNQHVDYDTWIRDYALPVTAGNWAGNFLAICDPDPPALKKGSVKKRKILFTGESLLNEETAATYAKKALADHNFFNQKFLEKLNTSAPVLIQRLDRSKDYYYIVPITDDEKRNYSLICVDARFGNYQQSAFSSDKKKYIRFSPLSKDEIIKKLKEAKELPHKLKNTIYPETLCIYPTLVWKPCKESLSPYLPFHMIIIGENRIYIRIDGEVFTSLTTNEKGI